MYEFIRGKLFDLNLNEAIVEVHGVGYRISIPTNSGERCPRIGEEILLYTTFIVREQLQALYGFLSKQERDLFTALTAISGIGPRTALGVLGHFPLPKLREILVANDVVALSKVPGIGKKTATRLLLDLGGKVLGASPICMGAKKSVAQDAISALTNLGYSQNKAQLAVQKALAILGEGTELSSLITESLKGGYTTSEE